MHLHSLDLFHWLAHNSRLLDVHRHALRYQTHNFKTDAPQRLNFCLNCSHVSLALTLFVCQLYRAHYCNTAMLLFHFNLCALLHPRYKTTHLVTLLWNSSFTRNKTKPSSQFDEKPAPLLDGRPRTPTTQRRTTGLALKHRCTNCTWIHCHRWWQTGSLVHLWDAQGASLIPF